MSDKVDLKRSIPTYAAPKGRFEIVDVPAMRFLAVEGSGDPNTAAAYADAVATIFSVAYTLKFASKRELGRDYVVMPLEAQWWSDDMASFTAQRDKTRWNWRVLNLVPEWIPGELVDRARDAAASKAPSIDLLRVDVIDEGRAVQTLHVGSYDDEAPVLAAMHDEFIPGRGLRMTGLHHEIYLNDARRTAPEKLRTILRQPVRAE